MAISPRPSGRDEDSEEDDAGMSDPLAQQVESDSDSEFSPTPVMTACGLPSGYNFSTSIGREAERNNAANAAINHPHFQHVDSNLTAKDLREAMESESSSSICGLPVGYKFSAPGNQ